LRSAVRQEPPLLQPEPQNNLVRPGRGALYRTVLRVNQIQIT
jgi:hypothetical protein